VCYISSVDFYKDPLGKHMRRVLQLKDTQLGHQHAATTLLKRSIKINEM